MSEAEKAFLHSLQCPFLSVESVGKAVLYVPSAMYEEVMPRLRPLLRTLTMAVNVLEVEYPQELAS